MNKLILGLILSTVFAGSPAQAASVVSSNSHAFVIPKDRNDKADDNARFAPPSLISQGGWTTCTLGHSGKGVIAGVNFSGLVADQGSAGLSVAMYDSTVVGSHSAGTVDTARLIFGGKVDTYRQSLNLEFSPPIPYILGLVICNGSTGVRSEVRFFKQQS